MKTTQELAENYLSSKDLKKRATALKRVASGIKSESANASFLKLDAKELPVSISAKAARGELRTELPLSTRSSHATLQIHGLKADHREVQQPPQSKDSAWLPLSLVLLSDR